MSETVRETIKRVYDEACNYYQLFEGESDRGAAVLAHALFEHKLSEAIKSRDEVAFSKERKLWVNIRIAYSLGLFDRETLDALVDINWIRNKFAHSRELLTFKHEIIVTRPGIFVPEKVRENLMEEDKADANAEVQTGTDRNGAETDRGGHGEWEVDAAGLHGG